MSFEFSGLLALTRPVNVLLGAASIAVGAWLTAGVQWSAELGLACLSGALVMAGGNCINDYFDAEIDAVNKPFRPIPAGRVSAGYAVSWASILLVLGVFLSIFLNWTAFVLALSVALGLVLYGWRLKRSFLLGNLAVSLFSAIAFVYGGVAVGRWQLTFFPACFAFLFHLGREIIKDVADRDADRVAAARTLPILHGPEKALVLASTVFAALICLTFVPYALDVYGRSYLVVVVTGVDLVLVGIIYFLLNDPPVATLNRVSTILKIDMLVGLFAIYLGSKS